MADDDAVIRRRLLTRTSTVGKSGLRKCAETLLGLVTLLSDEAADDATCRQELDALLWELEQLQAEAAKTRLWNFTCARELQQYAALNADIDTSIARAQREIEALKRDVHAQRTVRAYKEEYESIARVINALPSRADISAEIETERRRLAEATAAVEAVGARLELRTKQFALLMNTIHNLQATLDEDALLEEEQRRQEEDDDMEDVEPKRPGDGGASQLADAAL
ncbi:unnamed protein product [Phytophthora fragariaefolia]|uniref:Unnamed protein product n=1 Tax=Phytophthora fragariaefolia TaxID=1490495 RepID=A0A9W6UCY1_9STRA|nr:unnamed protein product [Phytophthora fragariaefolia]